jgi:hypothetical protein
MNDKIGALKSIAERFEANYAQYMSASYGEATARANFIDRFFVPPDRDARNEQGFSETYRDVVREDKVLVSGQMRVPDYSFRVGGAATFYAEAKRPSAHIKDNADTAYPCVYAAPIRGDGAEL